MEFRGKNYTLQALMTALCIGIMAAVLVGGNMGATFGPLAASPILQDGRCTLISGTAVATSGIAGATTLYYTPDPDHGNRISLYNGRTLVPYAFSELSNASAASSTNKAGPAVVGASKVNDIYVWDDSGTARLTRSPDWNSTTVRSATGTGTTRDCTTVPGVCTNGEAITNGPAVNRGRYVCTVASDSSSQWNQTFGLNAASGTQAVLGVWNKYNRKDVAVEIEPTGTTWATVSNSTWRAAANGSGSSSLSASIVRGDDTDPIMAMWCVSSARINNTKSLGLGIGIDSSTVASQNTEFYQNNTGSNNTLTGRCGRYRGLPGLGVHSVNAIEWANDTTGVYTGRGGLASSADQSSFFFWQPM